MLQDPEAQAVSCTYCEGRRAGFADDVALTFEGFGPEELGITFDTTGVAHDSELASFDAQWNLVGHVDGEYLVQ